MPNNHYPALSVFFVLLISSGCPGSREARISLGDSTADEAAWRAEREPLITAFCGDCHAMPRPESFPKEAWHAEVERGYGFYFASGRSDLEIPVKGDVHRYFVSLAPEKLPLPVPAPVDPAARAQFAIQSVALPGNPRVATSAVGFIDGQESVGRSLVISDMKGGGLYLTPLQDGQPGSPRQIATLRNPARVEPCDWDGDGWDDLIVADLGSFLPADHDQGRVVWLRQLPDGSGQYEMHELMSGRGRIADVRSADFNGDGLLDLLVAEFGWHETGAILWLERGSDGHPTSGLTRHIIDERPGTIHLPVVDLDGNGTSDFVALISQEHERVEAFLNDGAGNFRAELIFAAADPSYGSSGIELADMNADGLVDVVYSSGDSFDSFLIKPYHGIYWLENRGEFPHVPHRVADLPGAHRAVVGDINGDGLQDIVAAALLPPDTRSEGHDSSDFESLVWLEQRRQGEFVKHVLETGAAIHATVLAHDLDDDDLPELVTGNFWEPGSDGGPAISVWENRFAPR